MNRRTIGSDAAKRKRCGGEPSHLVNSFLVARQQRTEATIIKKSVSANPAAPTATPVAARPVVDRRRDIDRTAIKSITAAPAASIATSAIKAASAAPGIRRRRTKGRRAKEAQHDQNDCRQAAHNYVAVRNTGFFSHNEPPRSASEFSSRPLPKIRAAPKCSMHRNMDISMARVHQLSVRLSRIRHFALHPMQCPIVNTCSKSNEYKSSTFTFSASTRACRRCARIRIRLLKEFDALTDVPVCSTRRSSSKRARLSRRRAQIRGAAGEGLY